MNSKHDRINKAKKIFNACIKNEIPLKRELKNEKYLEILIDVMSGDMPYTKANQLIARKCKKSTCSKLLDVNSPWVHIHQTDYLYIRQDILIQNLSFVVYPHPNGGLTLFSTAGKRITTINQRAIVYYSKVFPTRKLPADIRKWPVPLRKLHTRLKISNQILRGNIRNIPGKLNPDRIDKFKLSSLVQLQTVNPNPSPKQLSKMRESYNKNRRKYRDVDPLFSFEH